MSNKIIEILIGIPAAGKSTWIRNNMNSDTVVISSDDIIEKLAAERGGTYDEHFRDLIGKASAKAKANFREAVKAGVPRIVVDRTNLTAKSRREWINVGLKNGYTVNAIVFPTPDEETLKSRLASRPGKTIPDHVIADMQNRLSMPRQSEGFSDIQMVS